jgi:biopolymer transport protein ExbB
MILELINKGGPIMWALFGGALFAFSLIFFKLFQLTRLSIHYKKFKDLNIISEHIRNNNFEKAKSYCLENGPIKPLINRGILLLEKGYDKETIKDQLELIYDDECHKLENGLSIILISGEIMPMLGLLGTVAGMIHVFEAISAYGTSDAQSMAAGISEALLTTETGLVLAIPILFFYTLLTHQVDSITKYLRSVGGSIVHLSKGVSKESTENV